MRTLAEGCVNIVIKVKYASFVGHLSSVLTGPSSDIDFYQEIPALRVDPSLFCFYMTLQPPVRIIAVSFEHFLSVFKSEHCLTQAMVDVLSRPDLRFK